jgi:hypothetical protein
MIGSRRGWRDGRESQMADCDLVLDGQQSASPAAHVAQPPGCSTYVVRAVQRALITRSNIPP